MSKAVGFLTGQASMAFEMLSTAWKALKKKLSLNLFSLSCMANFYLI